MRNSVRILGVLLALSTQFALGQSEVSLYGLHQTTPQAAEINPGILPGYRLAIGLPANVYGRVSIGSLRASDFLPYLQSADSTVRASEITFLEGLPAVNQFSVNQEVSLFHLGWRFNRSYLSLTASQHLAARVAVPTNIFSIALGGFPGESDVLNISDFDLNAQLYVEVGLGYTQQVNEQLTVGGRVKFYSGLLAAESRNLEGTLHWNRDSIALSTSGPDVNVGAPEIFSAFSINQDFSIQDVADLALANPVQTLLGGNYGFGVDLGAQYYITPQLSVNASLHDLGYIRWTGHTPQYQVNPFQTSFTGVDPLSEDTTKYEVESYYDTAWWNNPYADLGDQGRFTTPITTKVYLGTDYKVLPWLKVGGMTYMSFFNGELNPGVAAYANVQLGQWVNLVTNVSYADRQLGNIGVGASVNVFGLNVYATTNRINYLFGPEHLHSSVDVRAGVNLVIGDHKRYQRNKYRGAESEESALVQNEPQSRSNERSQRETSSNRSDRRNPYLSPSAERKRRKTWWNQLVARLRSRTGNPNIIPRPSPRPYPNGCPDY